MKLFFDLDGTLYNTIITCIAAAKATFVEYGLPLPAEDVIMSGVGMPSSAFMRNLFGGDEPPEGFDRCFTELEYGLVSEVGELFDGVHEMLLALKDNGHSLNVCSNGGEKYIDLVLNRGGIKHLFDGIYTAKYHPSKAEKVAELLSNDTNAVFIGDTADDRVAARRNNLPFIAALYGFGGDGMVDNLAYKATKPSDILGIVNQLEVFQKLADSIIKSNKRLIGINGVDTSGKTRFADNFAQYLESIGRKVCVIHIDDYHNPLEIRRSGLNEIDAYYNNAFDYAQLISELIEPLSQNGSIYKDVICLDLDADTYSKKINYSIDNETIIILEGVLLYRPPLAGYIDFKVFLDMSFDEVLKRALDMCMEDNIDGI